MSQMLDTARHSDEWKACSGLKWNRKDKQTGLHFQSVSARGGRLEANVFTLILLSLVYKSDWRDVLVFKEEETKKKTSKVAVVVVVVDQGLPKSEPTVWQRQKECDCHATHSKLSAEIVKPSLAVVCRCSKKPRYTRNEDYEETTKRADEYWQEGRGRSWICASSKEYIWWRGRRRRRDTASNIVTFFFGGLH